MNPHENFKHNLKTLRISRSIGGKELSLALNLKAGRIHYLEDPNKPGPNTTELTQIAEFFGVSVDDLIKKRVTLVPQFN